MMMEVARNRQRLQTLQNALNKLRDELQAAAAMNAGADRTLRIDLDTLRDESQEAAASNAGAVRALRIDLDDLRDESQEAAAIAIALGGLRIPYDKDRAFSMRIGHFRGESAIAAQGAFRLDTDPDVVFNIGAAHGIEYSQTGFTAGITWSW